MTMTLGGTLQGLVSQGDSVTQAATLSQPVQTTAPQVLLDQLEQHLFGESHPQEPVEARLDRLESWVYGSSRGGKDSVNVRINRLAKDVSLPTSEVASASDATSRNQPASSQRSAGKGGKLQPQLEPMPSVNSAARPSGQPMNNGQPGVAPVSGGATAASSAGEDYPILTQLENQWFGKSYSREEIHQRLGRLERFAYGREGGGSLADRVDRLRERVKPVPGQQPANPPVTASDVAAQPDLYAPGAQAPDPGYTPADGSQPPGNGAWNVPPSSVSQADMQQAVTELEKQTLRKTYPSEPLDNRLARLEKSVFNSTAPPNMPPEARLQRLLAVAVADSGTTGGGLMGGGGGRTGVLSRSHAGSPLMSMLPLLIMLLPFVVSP
jgi:hypothetical protein